MLATTLAAFPEVRVSVLTTGDVATAIDDDGVTVRRAMPAWSLRQVRSLVRQLRWLQPDIVHVQYPTQGFGQSGLPWLIPLLARVCGAQVVQTWHEGFNRRDLAKFLLMLAVPGQIVVVRETYLRQIRRPFDMLAGCRRPRYINSASTLPKVTLSQARSIAIREKYRVRTRRMIVFFGFLHPLKRVELLFEIADPATDHLLVIGETGDQGGYATAIEALSRTERWRGRSTFIGFADADEAAAVLSTADAIVLPLKLGGGEWNTSILAGVLQGTFVLTTSALTHGYQPDTNIYYARIDDVDEMRQALKAYAGVKRLAGDDDAFDWNSIAKRHLALYRSTLSEPRGSRAVPVNEVL